MIVIILIVVLAVFAALIALLVSLNYRLWTEREDGRRLLAVERMAAANLVEAVRNGEGAAAVRAWEER